MPISIKTIGSGGEKVAMTRSTIEACMLVQVEIGRGYGYYGIRALVPKYDAVSLHCALCEWRGSSCSTAVEQNSRGHGFESCRVQGFFVLFSISSEV